MKKQSITQAILSNLNEEWIRPPVSPKTGHSNTQDLQNLREKCKTCTACPLYQTATNLVFGEGNPESKLVIVGEAPGKDEDLQGLPFVGRSGKLLTKTLEENGMPRSKVYICNILKHRPPENRNPLPDEIIACTPNLVKQLAILQPAVILTLGNFSTQFMLDTKVGITKLRGQIHSSPFGYNVLPTLHPAAILRNMGNLPLFQADIAQAIRIATSQTV